MTTSLRIAAFVLGLAAVFGAAAGVGATVGPIGTASTTAASASGHGDAHGDAAHVPAPGQDTDPSLDAHQEHAS